MSEEYREHRHRPLNGATPSASEKGTALITGASSGIGAVYADRLARRGHDLVIVARNEKRLDALAAHLMADTGRSVKVIVADLNDEAELGLIEKVLRTDPAISMLVNNAGFGSTAPLLDADVDTMVKMVDLNVTALVRLTYAVVPAFVNRGGGTVINIASAMAIWPELLNGVYGGTKAFVLAFSLTLHKELAERKIRVQAVLPGGTATGFWDVAGTPVESFPRDMVMSAEDMVDAAIAGLDLGELVTIPSLPDYAEWEAYEAARQQMMPKLSRSTPAGRYGVTRLTALHQ